MRYLISSVNGGSIFLNVVFLARDVALSRANCKIFASAQALAHLTLSLGLHDRAVVERSCIAFSSSTLVQKVPYSLAEQCPNVIANSTFWKSSLMFYFSLSGSEMFYFHWKYLRIIVHYCCEERGTLSRIRRWSYYCHVMIAHSNVLHFLFHVFCCLVTLAVNSSR